MANATPITQLTGQKALTRRTVLAGLTFATATPGLPLPKSGHFNLRGLDAACHPHPVTALPFVRTATDDEKAAGAAPRDFWVVAPTGRYGEDCATGTRYAELALDYMVRENSPYILQWCAFDMMALDRAHSGIEVGFLGVFGRLAVQATRSTPVEGGVA